MKVDLTLIYPDVLPLGDCDNFLRIYSVVSDIPAHYAMMFVK